MKFDRANTYIARSIQFNTMEKYLSQLIKDLQLATLNRWRMLPPHYYEMGMPDKWLTPPKGYNGPPFGFGHEEDPELNQGYMAQLEFEKTQAEVENYLAGNAPASMYGYFGFDSEQFPPENKLQEEQLKLLCDAICRLWAAYNYTPVFPEKTPPRRLYPILLQAMHEPRTQVNRGHIGVEFCDYEPDNCPFGSVACSCKDF